MRLFTRFWRDQRGSFVARVANVSLALAIGGVALASVLDHATRDGGASVFAFFHPQGSASTQTASQAPGGGVDPTPTGSISRAVILDPCTGRQK